MKLLKCQILLILLTLCFYKLSAQATNQILVLRNLNSGKEKVIASNSKFKAKLANNEKIKGRIVRVEDSFFISDQNDTICFSKIRWIKAKRNLSKRQRGAGIAGLFAGLYFTPAILAASSMIYLMERTTPGNPAIFLVNAIPIGVTVVSIRALAGRRYKMKNWELQTMPVELKNAD